MRGCRRVYVRGPVRGCAINPIIMYLMAGLELPFHVLSSHLQGVVGVVGRGQRACHITSEKESTSVGGY